MGYRFAGQAFDTWEGAVQAPAGQGSRQSRVRTATRCASFPAAYLTAYGYSNLVSPFAAYTLITDAGTTLEGVRVAAFEVESIRVVRGAVWLISTWTLVW